MICKVTFATASKGRLVRAGKTVARGRVGNGRARLAGKRRISRGPYTLVAGKRTLRVRLG